MNRSLITMTPRARIVVAIAALFVALGAVAPAHADHRSQPRVSWGHSSHRSTEFGCGTSHRTSRSFAAIEFERGFEKGRHAGFGAGYRDGFHARCFSNVPKVLPCGVSRAYQEGYEQAFCKSYEVGFEQGKRERCCHRPRFSCR